MQKWVRNLKDRQTRSNIHVSPQRRKLKKKKIEQMLNTINQGIFSEIKKN